MKNNTEQEIRISPPKGLIGLNYKEYYNYRHMLVSLVKRDISSQYDDTYLGIFWILIRPISVTSVFTMFKSFSGANTYVHSPYIMYVYSGIIFWYYFTDAVTQTAGSVRKDAAIIGKIYFPRLITPIVPIISNLIGLVISFVPLLMMMAWFQLLPGPIFLLFPFVMFQCMILAFGIGTLFAALTINNRDLEQFLSFILYIGIFVSCVFFLPEMIPNWARSILLLNPMCGTMLAFRACLLQGFLFPIYPWLYSIAFSVLSAVVGVFCFRSAEATFVERM